MKPVDKPRVYSGRYELTHLIARGGMAQVYRAMDRQLDRPVALKVLFPELSVDRTFVERFRREAQAAANLSHPNIVPVFDWGEDDGSYFIVMEYVEGRPLSAVLRDPQRLPPIQIATIGAGVAAALAFAHRHGVVHRDVKPGNVLITPEGDVKVTDFGIARAVNTEESLTQTGAVMGTAAYFSPEQAEGKGVDARSDIYSLGVVLYEMAVGRPPFTGDSPVAVASKHVRDTPALPREVNPAVPAALEAVVMKAMCKDPDQRYGSAEELRADLLRFAEGRPVEAGDPGMTSTTAAVGATTQAVPVSTGRTMAVPAAGAPTSDREGLARKKRTRRLVVLLIALLVALGVITYFLLRSVLVADVKVPNVVGVPQAEASQTLQNDNLTVGTTKLQTDVQAKGIVLSTTPAAGVSVSKNSAVNLVVSSGPHVPIVAVPTVTGKQLTQAAQLIQAAGLTLGPVHYVTSQSPIGIVLSQDPAGGAKVRSTVPIVLTVSGTQSSVKVPSVLGESPASAGATLSQAGLNVGSQSSACSSQFASGLVSVQEPAAGATIPPNTSVNLVISSGSCVAVPNVVGQSQTAAQTAITAVGLVTNTTFDTTCAGGAIAGNVDAQNPAASAQVPSGSTVNISVCQPTTTTSSSTTTTTTPSPPSSTTTTKG
jgi:eukaryotic-like serine/threonine-protein kinase